MKDYDVVGRKKGVSAGHVVAVIVICLFAAFFLFPFYWMITGSFKPMASVTASSLEIFPSTLSTMNWEKLFKYPAFKWLFNSMFTAFGTMVLVCFTSAMAGYSLAKKQYPGREALFWLFVGMMTLPRQVLLVPLFTMVSKWGWLDSFEGLIFPAVGWPFGVFLMKQFSQTLPTELLEAAKIDGCSEFRTFWDIVLPLVKPGMGALAIFTFMTSWNDYFWQLVLIQSTPMKTLPLGVAGLQMEWGTDYGLLMAGGTASSLPMIVVFLAFQKYFTKGITLGAVKG
ncbi:MAG: carbohydrate ABC transporter permease [Clostridia bacterium]|nr:carbohydrate ABC transporter permease [Clostridia bacterium]